MCQINHVFKISIFPNSCLYLNLKNKNTVDSSVTGHSSDEEDSNSGDSDGSHIVNDNTRSDVNQQNNDIAIQPQISQAQHSKLEPVDFLSSSGNNHDLHNTSISIEQQSRHSFPTSISSGVSIISSLQGLFILCKIL